MVCNSPYTCSINKQSSKYIINSVSNQRQENFFFKIPNVCSIITRFFAWDLLKFNSDGVEGV